MNAEQLKRRTKEFAKSVIDLCRQLPDSREGRKIGDQIFASGTSVGANYRAVCRARSGADFISKMGVVLEEADETQYWLEIIDEKNVLRAPRVQMLLQESDELIRIFAAALNTAKSRSPKYNKLP